MRMNTHNPVEWECLRGAYGWRRNSLVFPDTDGGESGEHYDGHQKHREVHCGHGSGRSVSRQGSHGVAKVDPSLSVIYLLR
jgi:hypothetical protein